MSTQRRDLVIIGVEIPTKEYWQFRDEVLEPQKLDEQYEYTRVEKEDVRQLRVLTDGMCGKYTIVGLPLAMGDDEQGFTAVQQFLPVDIETLAQEFKKKLLLPEHYVLHKYIQENINTAPEIIPRLFVLTHYY